MDLTYAVEQLTLEISRDEQRLREKKEAREALAKAIGYVEKPAKPKDKAVPA